MAIHRVKFIWGSGNVIKAHWWLGLVGIYSHRPGMPGTGVAISMRGLLRWAGALGIVGYLATAAIITRSLRRTPHNQIGFIEVLTWPVRRGHIAELRGRAYIAQGRDALAAKRFGEGLFLLRHGLAACPGDFAARLTLAEYLLRTGPRTRALALLVEAPTYGLPSRAWYRRVLEIGVAGDDWSFILQLCDGSLPQLTAVERQPERQDLLAAKASALIALGQASDALSFAAAAGDAAGLTLKTQRLLALLALGRPAEAAQLSARWLGSAGTADQPTLMRLYARALREAGQRNEMEQVLTELQRLQPGDAPNAGFCMVQRILAGSGANALEDYLFRFGGTMENLVRVAEPLAEIPAVPLVERIVAAAAEQGYPVRAFRVRLAQALLRQGDWPALARLVIELEPMFSRKEPETWIWFEWIRALAGAISSPDSGAQNRLTSFLKERALLLPAYRQTILSLRNAGRIQTAAAALSTAQEAFPESPWLRGQQAEVERNLAALIAAAPAPPPVVHAPEIGNDVFFKQLDTAVTTGKWPEARQMIETLRAKRPVPVWLSAHDADLLRHELRITQQLEDVLALQLTARLFLNGDAVRAEEVLAFAGELDSRGMRADAILLARTVLEKMPGEPAAMRLLAVWQPPAKAKTN